VGGTLLKDSEEKLLTELCSALEIDEKTAVKIIDVMLVKNKG
jgi:DNA-directed RNA polymerase subunit F